MANEDLPSGCKRCKGCNQVKPFEEFGKELKGKFGLKSKCKLCISDKNRIYGHSRFCNTDFDDKLACLNLSGV